MKISTYKSQFATKRVLINGLSGTGKSSLASTLARKFNVIWIDTENAVEILEKLPLDQQERVRLIKIPDTASFPMAAQTIQRLFKDKKANICDVHGAVDCPKCKKDGGSFEYLDFDELNPKTDIVVLDSLTQVAISMFCNLMRGKPVDYKPERDDWGGLRKNTEYLAGNIQGANINLVCITLPTEAVLENGKTKLIPQFGSNPMCQVIAAKFGTVIYTDVINKKHVAFSSSTHSNTILSKSRTDFAIENLAELDLCPLFEQGDNDAGVHTNNGTDNSDGTDDDSNKISGQDNTVTKLAASTPAQNALASLRARQNTGVATAPSILAKK